jgi:hypothetical protein
MDCENKKTVLTRTRRCHAIISETVEYEVCEAEYNRLLDTGYSLEDALEHLLSESKEHTKALSSEVEALDILAVHEEEVS